jgi:hypothetical protein
LEPVSLSKLIFSYELLHSLHIRSLKNEVGTAAGSCDKKSALLYFRTDTYIYIHRDTHTFSLTEKILNHLKKLQVVGGTELLNFLQQC